MSPFENFVFSQALWLTGMLILPLQNPLMKEPKTARLFCVNCNMYAITEEEYEAMKAKAPAPAAPTVPAPSAVPQPTTTTSNATSSSDTKAPTVNSAPSANQAPKSADARPSSLNFTPASFEAFALPPAPKPSESAPAPVQQSQRPASQAQAALFERSRVAALRTIEVITERMENLNRELEKCGINWEYATKVLAQQEQCASALVTYRNMCIAMNFI